MSTHALWALAAAFPLMVPAAPARADGTSAFGAANAAQLLGYTASPAQLYVPAGNPSAGLVTGPVPGARRPKAPARAR